MNDGDQDRVVVSFDPSPLVLVYLSLNLDPARHRAFGSSVVRASELDHGG